MRKLGIVLACTSLLALSACGGTKSKTCTIDADGVKETVEMTAKGDKITKTVMIREVEYTDGVTKDSITDEDIKSVESVYDEYKGIDVKVKLTDKAAITTTTFDIDKFDDKAKSFLGDDRFTFKGSVEDYESKGYTCK